MPVRCNGKKDIIEMLHIYFCFVLSIKFRVYNFFLMNTKYIISISIGNNMIIEIYWD
jgi:hypothetical protein